MKVSDATINQQIHSCTVLLKEVLGEDLLGVYLYGSSLLGGLQKYSDIDLFAVSSRNTTLAEKQQLEVALLKISGIYAVSVDRMPIELTIVVKSDLNPWRYPPKFDFLYGDWMRKDFESGIVEPWSTKELPNLALVITQLLLSHKVLYGEDPATLLPPIPYKDFFIATTSEIESLVKDLSWDTRNVLLTLARIWCTLETDSIRSKSDAVSYAIDQVPEEYRPALLNAKSILLGESDDNWDGMTEQVKTCAEFMIDQINKQMGIIKSSNYTGRTIKIR